MGNCGLKPLTTEAEEAPAPEQKTTVEEREIEVDQNKVIAAVYDDQSKAPLSLAQMLEDEGKKPEAEGAEKPAEAAKPIEPVKIEEVANKEVAVETKKEEAPKPVVEPPKPEASALKPAETKPAVTTAVEITKPAVTPAVETKPAVTPAAVPVTAEKKPVAK